MLTQDDRYSRQILFAPIGPAGQEKIRNARVLVAGCGGLGAASAELLARAGVGYIRIVDRDFVEFSNLQRQSLFDELDVRHRIPKAIAAARHIEAINSEITVAPVVADINPHNIAGLMQDVNLVVDGLDNFEGRYLINDASVKFGVPWIYGACVGSYGISTFIAPGRTPCLRCLFSEPPGMGVTPTCDTEGVIAPALHIVAAIQAAGALQWIVTGAPPAGNALISFDVWESSFDRLEISYDPIKNPCPCCVERKFDYLNSPGAQTTSLCGRNAVQVCPASGSRPDFFSIAARLRPLGHVTVNEFLLRFENQENELTLFDDGRTIVKGTDDPALARSLVSRYFGV